MEPRYATLIPADEQRDEPVAVQSGQLWKLQVSLYGLLCSYVGGEDNKIFSKITNMNGFEGFRQLSLEHQPRLARRRMYLLSQLLNPRFGAIAKMRKSVVSWENQVLE